MMLFNIVLPCFLFINSGKNYFFNNHTVFDKIQKVNQLLEGLENVLNYCHENYVKLNIDALLGITLAKAHLDEISVNTLVVKNLVTKAERILKKSKSEISAQQILLDQLLKPKLWKKNIVFKSNQLKFSKLQFFETCSKKLLWKTMINFKKRSNDDLKVETISNRCILSFLKSDLVFNNCTIEKICQKNFIDNEKINKEYGILHRLLFIQIAQTRKCLQNKKVDHKINKLCSSVFYETYLNYKFGFIQTLDDLLLEQMLLCGQEGFTEFLNPILVNHVLKIQKSDGCFSSNQQYKTISERRKKNSNQISENCTDHTTGLGAAVMSLLLRYYLSQ